MVCTDCALLSREIGDMKASLKLLFQLHETQAMKFDQFLVEFRSHRAQLVNLNQSTSTSFLTENASTAGVEFSAGKTKIEPPDYLNENLNESAQSPNKGQIIYDFQQQNVANGPVNNCINNEQSGELAISVHHENDNPDNEIDEYSPDSHTGLSANVFSDFSGAVLQGSPSSDHQDPSFSITNYQMMDTADETGLLLTKGGARRIRHEVYSRIQTADGQERVKCKMCNKTYKYSKDVWRHIKEVHQGRRFACDLCGKVFRRGDSLISHRARQHAIGEDYAQHLTHDSTVLGRGNGHQGHNNQSATSPIMSLSQNVSNGSRSVGVPPNAVFVVDRAGTCET